MKITSRDNVWFTSDTHYAHANICSATSSWKDTSATRLFDSLDAMNDRLVDSINAVVKRDDILFHLGDWSFGGVEKIAEFRRRLNVEEIHLVTGNHDKNLIRQWEDGHARGLFSSVQPYLEIQRDGMPIVLFHYGMRVWNGSHKGAIHLYGHSHHTLPPLGRSMDVGVDTNNYAPYSMRDISSIMMKRDITFGDYHGQRDE